MSDKSSRKRNWSMLFKKSVQDTKFCYNAQSYNKSLVSEQEFKDYRKMIKDSLKKYNNKQNMKDQKINNYSCSFYSSKEKKINKMKIALGNKADWKDSTDDERAAGFKIIEKFVRTLDQPNKNINFRILGDHNNEGRPYANVLFELEDEEDGRSLGKIRGNKQNRNQEQSGKLKGIDLEDKFDKSEDENESEIHKEDVTLKFHKKQREKEENIKKRKEERDEEKERKRRESKNKSNVEKQEEPEQDDGLEM